VLVTNAKQTQEVIQSLIYQAYQKGSSSVDIKIFTQESNKAIDLKLEGQEFIDFLCRNVPHLSDHIITTTQFAALVPSNPTTASQKEWETIGSQKINDVLQEIESGNIWLIQAKDNNYHSTDNFNDPDNLDKKIYQKTGDYSLAVLVTQCFNETLQEFPGILQHYQPLDLTGSLINSMEWLNANVGDFNELYKQLLIASKGRDNLPDEIYHFIDAFSNKIHKAFSSIHDIDEKMYGKQQIPDGAIDIKLGMPDQKGVVITTSSSGGCHKTIAANVAKELHEVGVNATIINESTLTKNDVLTQVTGISFAQLYPIVHQQNGMADYRNKLRDLNQAISTYMPDNRPALLRQAIKTVEEKYPIDSMYVTSHYAHNLRFLPEGAKIFYQVCDYGAIPSGLEPLANTAARYLPDTTLRFIVPSDSTRLIEAKITADKTFKKLSLPSVYPTAILNAEELKKTFDKTVNDFGLSQNPDINRCTIAMGGCGCADLITQYVEKLISEYQQNSEAQDPLEIAVVCGNNSDLVKALNEIYSRIELPQNLTIKILGMVPNQQFIALANHSALITKPGGGTVSECIQNNVSALVHYDPKHPWEEGNVIELEKTHHGKRIIDSSSVLKDVMDICTSLKKSMVEPTLRKNTKASAHIVGSMFSAQSKSRNEVQMSLSQVNASRPPLKSRTQLAETPQAPPARKRPGGGSHS
jgi:hypothetical protein